MAISLPIVAVAAVVLGAASLPFYAGWRARDLISKAVASAKSGNIELALLQAESATGLCGRDPAVRRGSIFVRSIAGDPQAAALWTNLAETTVLTAEEALVRARVAATRAPDAEFDKAMACLEEVGLKHRIAVFRAARALTRGNLAAAVDVTRDAVKNGGGADEKLALLELLIKRYGPLLAHASAPSTEGRAAVAEMSGLVDDLCHSTCSRRALDLGLRLVPAPAPKAEEWARIALQDASPANASMLAAAQTMIRLGKGSARDFFCQLSPVFAGAPANQKAVFSRWLGSQGMWDQAASLLGARELASHAEAYLAKAEALAGAKCWTELLAISETEGSAPSSLRLAFAAAASAGLGHPGRASALFSEAVRTGLRDGRFPQVHRVADRIGAGGDIDRELIRLCAEAAVAEEAFCAARKRFGRRGDSASLDAAWKNASEVVPRSAAVQDYRWRLQLLAGEEVDARETEIAVSRAPADVGLRLTHALALLKQGRAADALASFHDLDVFVEELSPADRSVVAAVYEANGLAVHASTLRKATGISPAGPVEQSVLGGHRRGAWKL